MDNKVLAVVAAAAVVVAAVAAVLVLNGGDSGEPASDYTLLDSEGKIAAGFHHGVTLRNDSGITIITLDVTSVEDGEATYTTETKFSGKDTTADMDDFSPLNFYMNFGFDYTDESAVPDGVTVTKIGTAYRITGTETETQPDYTVTATYDLVIALDESDDVTSVSGTYGDTYRDGREESSTTERYTTTDGVLSTESTSDEKDTDEDTVAAVYGSLLKYEEGRYAGIVTDTSSERFGNVDATVYTLNGTANGYTFKDFRYYVYNGYVIHGEGTIDDEATALTVSVHL